MSPEDRTVFSPPRKPAGFSVLLPDPPESTPPPRPCVCVEGGLYTRYRVEGLFPVSPEPHGRPTGSGSPALITSCQIPAPGVKGMLSNLWYFAASSKHFQIPFRPPEPGTLPTPQASSLPAQASGSARGLFGVCFLLLLAGLEDTITVRSWSPAPLHPRAESQEPAGWLEVLGAGLGPAGMWGRTQAVPSGTPCPIMARSYPLPRGLPAAKGLRAPLAVRPPAGTDGETIFNMLEVIERCPAASAHSKPVTPPPPPCTKSSSLIVHFHGTAGLSFGGLTSVVKNHYLCICLMSVSPEDSRPHEDRSPVHLH